jgi:hypothetical protein
MSEAPAAGWTLFGVDFTSAPRRTKPITLAVGHRCGDAVVLERIEALPDWPAFEALLQQPGPWLGAFDFPFGLPREAAIDLDWPQHWPELVRHCHALGRAGFRAALDAYRESRPPGRRYAHRATDLPARSHSPLKLVNPPVGLMFLEGAPRLLQAGVSLAGMHAADPQRIALEAYPGLLARSICAQSYKSDDKHKQTEARRQVRAQIVHALCSGAHALRVELRGDRSLLAGLIEDASGDRLDAVLALLQAAHGVHAGAPDYGLLPGFDALEGWIATCA